MHSNRTMTYDQGNEIIAPMSCHSIFSAPMLWGNIRFPTRPPPEIRHDSRLGLGLGLIIFSPAISASVEQLFQG